MAAVKESIKESLIGTIEEPQLSQEMRANFVKHAKSDEKGELYLGPEEFIDAIAPVGEDYVSSLSDFGVLDLTQMDPSQTNLCTLLTHRFLHSTRSSVNNSPSSSKWQIGAELARFGYLIGPHSRTCSPSPMHNMRSPSAYLMLMVLAQSIKRPSSGYTTRTRARAASRSTSTPNGPPCI
jgi:hypothetical protein